MGVFRVAAGYDRWKCLSCGQGGTAIDLLVLTTGVTVGQALRDLAGRTGHAPRPAGPSAKRRAPSPRPPSAAPTREPDLAIRAFVEQTRELLWEPIGAGARAHLTARGFTEDVLRANHVGFDPGPRQLPRRRGLPYHGPGIVYPVLHHQTGEAIYYQVRYLDPARAGRKYDQPTVALAPNPHLATIRAPGQTADRYVVVCEGFPDALTAAQASVAGVAIPCVAHAAPTAAADLATLLTHRYPRCAFAICFDNDTRPGKPPAGQDAAHRLADALANTGAPVARLRPPAPHNDLNDWWRHDLAPVAALLTGTASVLNSMLPAPTIEPSTTSASLEIS